MTSTERRNMEKRIADEVYRINATYDYPIGSMMLLNYGDDIGKLSTTELYELQDALRLVDDEN